MKASNITPQTLKTYLDELDRLIRRKDELLETLTNHKDNPELTEVVRLINYFKIELAKKVLDL